MIAVQLYTLRSLLSDPAQLAGVLGRLREIGYRTVEVAGLGPRTIDRFGEELARAGLDACALHAGFERLTGDFEAVVEECTRWRCEYVVVPSIPDSYRSGDGYRRFAAEASALALPLRERGLRLAYHNHAFELERHDGQTGLETILTAAGPEGLDAELDTYWLQFGGAHPASWIRRFKGRVPLVHLKDMAIRQGDPVDAEIGEGNLDWVEILRACRDAGTRWLVVEQDDPRRDPLEAVAVSYRNLVRLMSSVEVGR